MATIEIDDCGQCKKMKSTRMHDSVYKETCGQNNRMLNNRDHTLNKPPSVPDWCPLSPDNKVPEPERVYVVTAIITVPVVGRTAKAAMLRFKHEGEGLVGEPQFRVSGPVTCEEDLEGTEWDLDRKPWDEEGKTIREYIK